MILMLSKYWLQIKKSSVLQCKKIMEVTVCFNEIFVYWSFIIISNMVLLLLQKIIMILIMILNYKLLIISTFYENKKFPFSGNNMYPIIISEFNHKAKSWPKPGINFFRYHKTAQELLGLRVLVFRFRVFFTTYRIINDLISLILSSVI